MKPISFARFFKAIEKFLEQRQSPISSVENNEQSKNDYVFVRKDRKQVKVFFADILYVESVKDYVKIVTEGDSHLIKHGLSTFQGSLDHRFIRTHRSYIVNLDKITAYTKQDVEIGKVEIPIGDSYKLSLMDILEN